MPPLQVLGLTEGYHGDTLGAMEAVAPSPFNGRLQTPWYRGRGLFLEPPTAAVQDGAWRVQLPASFPTPDASSDSLTFGGEAEVFDVAARMGGPLYRLYRAQIEQELEAHSAPAAGQAPRRLGALILEPVLQGAGGMRLVDPLYQRALVEACRWVHPCERHASLAGRVMSLREGERGVRGAGAGGRCLGHAQTGDPPSCPPALAVRLLGDPLAQGGLSRRA